MESSKKYKIARRCVHVALLLFFGWIAFPTYAFYLPNIVVMLKS